FILSSVLCQILLNPLIEFLSRIVSHLFLSVVYRRRFHDDRQIPSRTDRDAVAYDLVSEEFRILLLQPQTVVLFVPAPVFQRNDQIDILGLSDALHTEHGSYVHDADASQLDEVLCDIRCSSDQRFITYLADLYHVIRHKTVSSLDQLQ